MIDSQLSSITKINKDSSQSTVSLSHQSNNLTATIQRRLYRSVSGHHHHHLTQASHFAQIEPSDQPGLVLNKGERGSLLTQEDLLQHADTQTRASVATLPFPSTLKPSTFCWSPNGTHVALGGSRTGHLALIHWRSRRLECELTEIHDPITSLTFLQDASLLAVAQSHSTFIYAMPSGHEVHRLPSLSPCNRLGFLPSHLLLVGSACQVPFPTIAWLDVSTGETVEIKPPSLIQNPLGAMTVCRQTGAVITGDTHGLVKLWSPTVRKPIWQLQSGSPITQLALDSLTSMDSLQLLWTLGPGGRVQQWDLRTLRPFPPLLYRQSSLTPAMMDGKATQLSVSPRGVLALASSRTVQLHYRRDSQIKQSSSVSLCFPLNSAPPVTALNFSPFEDLLGICSGSEFLTLFVPGSGELNPDASLNPFATETQRQSQVINSLLDKLPAESIALSQRLPNPSSTTTVLTLRDWMKHTLTPKRQRGNRQRQLKEESVTKNSTELIPLQKMADSEWKETEWLDSLRKKPTVIRQSKAERLAISKKRKWDRKDSAAKVKSKQKLRGDRMRKRQKNKWRRQQILE